MKQPAAEIVQPFRASTKTDDLESVARVPAPDFALEPPQGWRSARQRSLTTPR
jgi:hypothetical protein